MKKILFGLAIMSVIGSYASALDETVKPQIEEDEATRTEEITEAPEVTE